MEGFGRYTRQEYRNEFLSSPTWKFLRDEFLGNNFYCHKCFEKKPLDVHHCRYAVRQKDATIFMLALCRSCHAHVEKAKRLGYIKKEHNPQDALEVISKPLKPLKSSLSDEWLNMMNQASILHQRLACGILKILPPVDWKSIAGIPIAMSKIRALESIFSSGVPTNSDILSARQTHAELSRRIKSIRKNRKETNLRRSWTTAEMGRVSNNQMNFASSFFWITYVLRLSGSPYMSLRLKDLNKLFK